MGGKAVRTGADACADPVLEDAEVTAGEYVCGNVRIGDGVLSRAALQAQLLAPVPETWVNGADEAGTCR